MRGGEGRVKVKGSLSALGGRTNASVSTQAKTKTQAKPDHKQKTRHKQNLFSHGRLAGGLLLSSARTEGI